MANFKTHCQVGALVGLVIGLIEELIKDDENGIDFLKLLISTAGGALGGILPDRLEPPLHPNHRDSFHSILAGGVVTLNSNPQWAQDPYTKTFVRAACFGYVSHLALDARIPKSLPPV